MNQKLITIIVVAVVISLGAGYFIGSSSNASNGQTVSVAEVEKRDKRIETLEKEIVQLNELLNKKHADMNKSMEGAFDGLKNLKPSGKGHVVDIPE